MKAHRFIGFGKNDWGSLCKYTTELRYGLSCWSGADHTDSH